MFKTCVRKNSRYKGYTREKLRSTVRKFQVNEEKIRVKQIAWTMFMQKKRLNKFTISVKLSRGLFPCEYPHSFCPLNFSRYYSGSLIIPTNHSTRHCGTRCSHNRMSSHLDTRRNHLFRAVLQICFNINSSTAKIPSMQHFILNLFA